MPSLFDIAIYISLWPGDWCIFYVASLSFAIAISCHRFEFDKFLDTYLLRPFCYQYVVYISDATKHLHTFRKLSFVRTIQNVVWLYFARVILRVSGYVLKIDLAP